MQEDLVAKPNPIGMFINFGPPTCFACHEVRGGFRRYPSSVLFALRFRLTIRGMAF